MIDRRIRMSTYAMAFAPWAMIGLIGPWQVIAGLGIAGAIIVVAAKLTEKPQ